MSCYLRPELSVQRRGTTGYCQLQDSIIVGMEIIILAGQALPRRDRWTDHVTDGVARATVEV